jgi:hypothetical protein
VIKVLAENDFYELFADSSTEDELTPEDEEFLAHFTKYEDYA